jgi:hypothetical protein
VEKLDGESGMQFLIRGKGKKNAAHYWDGKDTACRMWSTGGMNQGRKWSVHDDPGEHPICTMCANVRKNAQMASKPLAPAITRRAA